MDSEPVSYSTPAMESKPASPPVPGWGEPTAPGPVPAVPADQPGLRIGRGEREQAEQRLRWALGEDILTINEFDDRLGAVLRATTRDELDNVLADLPPAPAIQQPGSSLRPCSRIVAIMGHEHKRGRWRPGRPLRVLSVMGDAKVDLRDAETDDGVFDIDAAAVMGGIDIIVPDNADVDLDGFAIMGGRENKVPAPDTTGGPLVRVNGYALMGGLVVRTANKRERKKYPVEADALEQPKAVGAKDSRQLERPPIASARRKSRGGRIVGWALMAVLVLGPGRAAVTADAVAIFGGNEYEPTQQQLAGEESVDVFALFGGVDVVIPDGYSAHVDSFSLFGGTDCERVCDRPGNEVQVDATAVFGGVDVSDGRGR